MSQGTWTDPERGKVTLAEYAATWISQRPKLRPRTVDHYRWLLKKHIALHLGAVPLGKLSTPMIRQWRARKIIQCLETIKAQSRDSYPGLGLRSWSG